VSEPAIGRSGERKISQEGAPRQGGVQDIFRPMTEKFGVLYRVFG
jgi:hypothetical protein